MESLNRFPTMMQDSLVRRIRAVDAANDERVFGLKSKRAALAYQDELRRSIRKSFGPLPRRTPLNARIVGELDRPAYRLEKIIFESRPNFPVTANLYLPKRHEFPLPAVLGVCGHSADGKAAEFYQSFSQGLAHKGYVVLIFDPISQGERMQYPDGKGGSRVGACCPEHNHIGKQQIIAGEFFGTWRVWDGIRALDYLLSRPEVDPAHIGITGNSGGGTMTTLLLANEDRFTMAAPSCYITTWRCNVENELPADAEQQPPKALGFGMDMSDLLMVHAPKPLIILTQEKDYFDVRGARQAYERLRHVYKLLGAPGNVAFFTGPDHHGYHPPNRRAMYTFFEYACGRATSLSSRGLALGSGRHLALEREPKLSIEDEATLYCTKSGQVDELRPATCFHFTGEKSQALAEKRGEVSGDKLIRAVKRLLHLPKRTGVPDYRILRQVGGRSYPRSHGTHYVIETGGGQSPEVTVPDLRLPSSGGSTQAIVIKLEDEPRYSRPLPGKGPAVLYLPHMSADEDLREDRLARELGRKHEAFFACDYRGIGESRPNSCGVDTFLNPYGSDYFYASYGLMFDEPYLGERVHDVLVVLDWMEHYGYDRVHLVGRGWGSIVATFAALLDDRVTRVTLKNAPISYSEMAETEDCQWPLSSMLPYVLERFDLPDLYRALHSKRLHLLSPWSASLKRLTRKSALRELRQVALDATVLA